MGTLQDNDVIAEFLAEINASTFDELPSPMKNCLKDHFYIEKTKDNKNYNVWRPIWKEYDYDDEDYKYDEDIIDMLINAHPDKKTLKAFKEYSKNINNLRKIKE